MLFSKFSTKKLILLGAIILLGIISGLAWQIKEGIFTPCPRGWLANYQAKNSYTGCSKKQVFVEIKPGLSTRQIAALLENKKIISHPNLFLFAVRISGKELKAGLYYFSPNNSLSEIINQLARGEIAEKKVTLIEGWRREQIAAYLDQKQIVDYADFLAASSGQEGKLFPDTYRLPARASAQEIVKRLTDNFNQKTASLKLTRQDIIIASIVEREAKTETDRRKIAGVYLNRLKKNMPLESCPTVQYAKDTLLAKTKNFHYWKPITKQDYQKINQPYNTYLHTGLPPGPICNPGLASLKAVKQPIKHNFYYFFHLKNGQAIYSHTFQEHQTNLAKYFSQM